TPTSVLFAAVVATNLDQAISLEERVKQLPSVSSVDSITKFLVEDQTRKLPIVDTIKKEVSSLHFPPPDPNPVNIPELSATLYYLHGYLGLAADDTAKDHPELSKQLRGLRQAIEDFRKEMLKGSAKNVAGNSLKLAAFQQALLDDVHDTFRALQTQDTSAPL